MFHQISDTTKNWDNRKLQPAQPIIAAGSGNDNTALQAIIAANTQAVKELAAALATDTHNQTAYSKYPVIDLTVAHTDLAITVVRPVDFIQVWSDGGLDGISIKIGDQGGQSLDFRQVNAIRVTNNPETIYFTNDVRQGRGQAVIYFVRGDYPE
jgi:hypothetical protein